MPRNTTRGTGNAIAGLEGGCETRVMELYLRLRHFTRPRRRSRERIVCACKERSVEVYAGRRPRQADRLLRIIDQFRADSRPEIVFSISWKLHLATKYLA